MLHTCEGTIEDRIPISALGHVSSGAVVLGSPWRWRLSLDASQECRANSAAYRSFPFCTVRTHVVANVILEGVGNQGVGVCMRLSPYREHSDASSVSVCSGNNLGSPWAFREHAPWLQYCSQWLQPWLFEPKCNSVVTTCEPEHHDTAVLGFAASHLYHPPPLIDVMSWESFLRSLLLFYFLSCLHLFAKSLPLRRGCETRNALVRKGRKIFAGAPVVLALFVVASMLPVSLAAPDAGVSRPSPSSSCGVGVGEVASDLSQVSEAAAASLDQSIDGRDPAPLFSPEPPPLIGGRESTQLQGVALVSDLVAAAAIHMYQKPTCYVKGWIGKDERVDFVVSTFKDCFHLADTEDVVLPVHPQPSADHVVLVCAPSWVLAQWIVPVLIQVKAGDKVRYVDYFVGGISCHDIRLSLGPYWVPGGQVFVGTSLAALPDGELVHVLPGTLIRVEAPRVRCAATFTLEHKLAEPGFWFKDVADVELCDDFEPYGAIGVLGTVADWLRVSTRWDLSAHSLHSWIADQCGIRLGSFRVEVPPRPLYNVAFRGRPITSVVGLIPRALDEASRIFVDARDLAVPLQVILLPRLLTQLDTLLHLLGASRPSGRQLLVEGCRSFEVATESFIPDRSETIKITVKPPEFHDALSGELPRVAPFGGNDDEGPDQPHDRVGAGFAGLHDPPCSVASENERDASGSTEVPGAALVGAEAGALGCVEMLGGCYLDPPVALDSVPLDGDQHVVRHVRCSSEVVFLPAIVHCAGGEVPRVDYAVDVFGRLPGDEGQPGGEESPEEEVETSDDAVPSEWCIQVSVLGFQSIPYTRTFWVAHGERPADLLVRLEILLAPAGSFYRLVIPALQPPGRALQLIMVPNWWQDVGRHAVLVVQPDLDQPAYVEVVGLNVDIEHILPLHSHARDETVELAVSGALRVAHGGVVDVATGDTLLLSGQRRVQDLCQNADDMVANAELHTRASEVPDRAVAPTLRYVLLGVAFEQNIIELRPGRVATQVAALLQMTPNELILETQSQPLFEHVCIRGTPVHRCMSVRSDRYFRRGVGSIIFIDPRSLGVPICCKNVFRLCLSPSELLRMLDVHLPRGFAAHCRAGEETVGPLDELSLHRNDSVVIWAVNVAPSRSVSQGAIEMGVELEREHDSSVDKGEEAAGSGPVGSRGSAGARSRSPRRSSGSGEGRSAKPSALCIRPIPTPCRVGGSLPILCDEVAPYPAAFEHEEHGSPVICRPEVVDCTSEHVVPLWKGEFSEHVHAVHPLADTSGAQAEQMQHASADDLCASLSDLSTVLQNSELSSRTAFLGNVAGFLGVADRGHVSSQERPAGPAGSARGPHDDGSDEGRCLCLHALLPPLTFDLTQQHFPVGKTLEDVVKLLSNDPVPLSDRLPSGVDLHPASRVALAHMARSRAVNLGRPIDSVEIFTDGSFNGTCSAWSFVVVHLVSQEPVAIWWAAGQVCVGADSPQWLGASGHGSMSAEHSAVAWAMFWMLVQRPLVPVVLHSDSICTVMRANGQWRLAESDTLSQTCRHLAQALDCMRCLHQGSIQHVKGHAGNPWNELADSLARHAIGHACTQLHDNGLSEWVREQALSHLWLLLAASAEPEMWPQHRGQHMADSGFVLPEEAPPIAGQVQQANFDGAAGSCWHALRVATLNVQTLDSGGEEGQAEYAGRAAYLRDQFAWAETHVVGIQEARTARAESFISGNFIRICSGCTSTGQLGVEAWFCRGSAAGSVGFSMDELIVTHWDPRILCVKVRSRFLNAVVVVAHAPTATDPARGEWWCEFQELLRHKAPDSPVCILGDLNVRLIEQLPGRVGDFVFPASHKPPVQLNSLLVEQDLWVPSTFPGVHIGQHETWCAPGSESMARIDFILIPCGWVAGEDSSWVSLDFDPGHKSVDHFPVFLDFWTCEKAKSSRKGKGRGLDRQAMATTEGRRKLRVICENLRLQPWSLDADTHFALMQSQLLDELRAAFPVQRAQRSSSFLSVPTWMLKDHRAWLRRQTLTCKKRVKLALAWVALRVWQRSVSWAVEVLSVALRLCTDLRHVSGFVRDLRSSRQELRRAVRHDRRQWLQELAEKALDQPVKDVVRQLRPLLRTSGKRQATRRAIPAVMLEDGSLADTHEAATARWVRHFEAVEGGSESTFDLLWQEKKARLQVYANEPVHIADGDVPTRCELEAALQRVSCGKACGPDEIPGEVLHFAAGEFSLPLFQLVLKFAVRRDEPIIWKGGLQYHLWKGRGSPSLCANHRGILVSSVVGKAAHSILRKRCVPEMLRIGTDMQVGGLPRFPVVLAAHAVRLYQGAFVRNSTVIVFLDLRDAFYRLVRPLLSDRVPTDTELVAIFQTLQLPASSYQAFRDKVCGGSLLTEAGTSEWLRGMLEEVLSSTWFHVPCQAGVIQTKLGSRPGDCLADLLFYVTFAEVLKSVQATVRTQQGQQSIPWHEDMLQSVGEAPVPQGDEHLDLFDVTWMDDLAVLSSFDCADQAIPALSSIVGALVDSCLDRGMLPNLGPGKSEAIVALRGPKARSLRAEFLSESDPSAAIFSGHWPQARVKIVPHYKHLGGFLHFRGGLCKEVSSRIGQAWSAFQRHKRTLFCHGHVPINHKVVMFKTLVIPVLFHACGAWSQLHASSRARLQRAYLNMCRKMIGRHCKEDILHLGEDRVLALLHLPSIDLWLHYFRLSYLCSFVPLAVRPLWALAHKEQRWLQEVRASLLWLWAQVDGGSFHSSWSVAWAAWKQDMCCRPRAWKRRIRFALESATRMEILQDGWQFCRGQALRELTLAGGVIPQWVEQAREGCFACGPCQRLFDTRQAWAVHAFKTHGRVREARRLVDGSHCPVCLKQFPSNIQLCRHVEHSVHCRRQLRARGFQGVVQPGVGCRKAVDGRDFLGVVKQGLGPKLPEVALEVTERDSFRDCCVWQALCSLLFSGTSFQHVGQLLEAYRRAFCLECVDPLLLVEVSRHWRQHVRQVDLESLNIRDAAMHGAAAEWLANHFTVEWLCAQQLGRPVHLATYRQSLAGLAMVDCSQVARAEVPFPVGDPVCLVCSAGLRMGFGAVQGTSVVLDLDWCMTNEAWSEGVLQGFVDLAFGFAILCLADLALTSLLPTAPVRRKVFEAHLRYSKLLQQATSLALRLWSRQHPFVALLPFLDEPLLSAIRQLPGLFWTKGDKLLIVHNVPEDHVPEFLFHLA